MGGRAFTVYCTLAYNRNYIDKITALPDTGVYSYTFLNTSCTIDIVQFLDIEIKRLDQPIIAKGYNSVVGQAITYYLVVDQLIDGRRLPTVPFLILDLGNHDMIIGAK